jgi:hypothetical protein
VCHTSCREEEDTCVPYESLRRLLLHLHREVIWNVTFVFQLNTQHTLDAPGVVEVRQVTKSQTKRQKSLTRGKRDLL